VEDAKDLTQEFFSRLLDKGHLERLQPDRGSFRGFLKRSIHNFVIDSSRREKARRPSEGAKLLSLEEYQESGNPPLSGNPEEAFDREWTQTVLQDALASLPLRLEQLGLKGYHEVFHAYCLTEGDKTYGDVAKQLNVLESAVRKRLARCREELRELVRERVCEYASDEEEIEAELREIIEG
jgi:RNA polymerase sigma-70 factor (ECF subfamily)